MRRRMNPEEVKARKRRRAVLIDIAIMSVSVCCSLMPTAWSVSVLIAIGIRNIIRSAMKSEKEPQGTTVVHCCGAENNRLKENTNVKERQKDEKSKKDRGGKAAKERRKADKIVVKGGKERSGGSAAAKKRKKNDGDDGKLSAVKTGQAGKEAVG